MSEQAKLQCGRHYVQAGTDCYCTRPSGHPGACIEQRPHMTTRDWKLRAETLERTVTILQERLQEEKAAREFLVTQERNARYVAEARYEAATSGNKGGW